MKDGIKNTHTEIWKNKSCQSGTINFVSRINKKQKIVICMHSATMSCLSGLYSLSKLTGEITKNEANTNIAIEIKYELANDLKNIQYNIKYIVVASKLKKNKLVYV
jgi:hypothetical protein